MKTSNVAVACLLLSLMGVNAQTSGNSTSANRSAALPAPTPYQIVRSGPNFNVWQRETFEPMPNGQVAAHTNSYTELASGLNYLDANGLWTRSADTVEAFPGGAIVRHGQHSLIFNNNLNSPGAIDMETPDGKRLRSSILGLMYDDPTTGQAVQIAELQDSEGELIANNEVLYPNAFRGVSADVLYRNRLDGMEQNVILKEQLPAPETYGMNPDTTYLEVFTEFLGPPEASVVDLETDIQESDQAISWGTTSLGRGKAFIMGDEDAPTLVTKRYAVVGGRYFLLEKVRLKDIQESLSRLPQHASNAKWLPGMASKHFKFPKTPTAKSAARPMRLAMGLQPEKGYVLDYTSLGTAYTNFCFQGDTEYYVSSALNLSGTNNCFEGGTVIKYATNASIAGTAGSKFIFLSKPYRPVILTAKDDNSISGAISGSTGNPSGYYGDPVLNVSSLSNVVVSDVRIAYANRGISAGGPSTAVYDAQFVNCGVAVSDIGGTVTLGNVLFSNVKTNFNAASFVNTISVQNATFNNGFDLINGNFVNTSLLLTNCAFVNQTNLSGNISAGYNGFYQSPVVGSPSATNTFYPLAVAGAASCYLNHACNFTSAGTTNVGTNDLQLIQAKTSFAPVIFSNVTISVATNLSPQAQRDNGSNPNLGYHYDPLDYVFGNSVAQSNLTFTAGTAAAWFYTASGGTYGLAMGDSATASFNGTVTAPCRFVRYSMVQEGNGNWTPQSWLGGMTGQSYTHAPPGLTAKFTLFSTPATEAGPYRDNWILFVFTGNDCEFYGSGGGAYDASINATNCLYVNGGTGLFNNYGAANLTLENCTFIRGNVEADNTSGQPWPVTIVNCAFDSTTFYMNAHGGQTNGYYTDYNSFLVGANTTTNLGGHEVFVTNSYNWQTSWLGNYYQLANSPLIDKGSTTADQVGLYHFTTQVSQMKETNSIVDIGYHYVAVSTNGQPVDSDGDGVPDYIQYPNGAPPTIIIQPTNQSATLGDDVFFTVVAAGFPGLSYQWYFNGAVVTGATNSTLELDGVGTNNLGGYYVSITNVYGSITSQTAYLTNLTVPASYIVIQNPKTNFIFQSDTTYYVNSTVQLYGTTTIEGGTVIKFGNHTAAQVVLNGPLICRTATYRPAVLTSKDDNSAGATIVHATGSPSTNCYATYLIDGGSQTNAYKGLRIAYARTGIFAANPVNLWDSQIVKCGTTVSCAAGSPVALHNVLISQVTNCVQTTGTISAEFLTADQCQSFCPLTYTGGYLTNSVLTSVGNTNGITLASSVYLPNGIGVYQVAGGGNYYLATNTYRNIGTSNVSSLAVVDIATKTTYAPQVYYTPGIYFSSNLTLYPQARRDTNSNPDVGYHYDPLDYIFGPTYVTNSTITINAGTAIGTFGSNSWYYGIAPANNGQFISQGAANNLNHIVEYNTVQEQVPYGWVESSYGMVINFAGTNWLINCRFTDWSSLAQDVCHVQIYQYNLPLGMRDCQFHGGLIESYSTSINLTNCLLERVHVDVEPCDSSNPAWRNNTFRNGTFGFAPCQTNSVIVDNLFDGTVIPDWLGGFGVTYIGGHNAYVTNCNTLDPTHAGDLILTNSPAYQTSWLGSYYLPPNSLLITKGSTTADQVGLFHFTTQTNQMKEGFSVVDIGYHYVATDAYGNPIDSNGDGIPDYLEDANGNGIWDPGELPFSVTVDNPANGTVIY